MVRRRQDGQEQGNPAGMPRYRYTATSWFEPLERFVHLADCSIRPCPRHISAAPILPVEPDEETVVPIAAADPLSGDVVFTWRAVEPGGRGYTDAALGKSRVAPDDEIRSRAPDSCS